MKIEDIFQSMAARRTIFRSQVDLRDTLADELNTAGYSCLLNREMGKNHKVDIWADDKKNDKSYVIEVKFKTSLLKFNDKGVTYELKNHSANDQARYDFIGDIVKLERVIAARPRLEGYAVLLTNDHKYWNKSKRIGTVDEQFHIHDGNILTGKLQWGHEASAGTMNRGTEPHILSGWYQLNWHIYSMASADKNGTFKVLVIKVNNHN